MKANRFKNIVQQNWTSAFICCVLAFAGILLVSCSATVSPSSFPKIQGESVLNPGDVAFTGIVLNGNSQFSFVPTTNIGAGVSIFFTDYSYDPTNNASPYAPLVDESTTSTSSSVYPGFGSVQWETYSVNTTNGAGNATTIQEGTIAYVTGYRGLAAYSQVVIGSGSDGTTLTSLQGGSVVNVNGVDNDTYLYLNHNGAGHKILAYAINGGTTTYIAAIIFGPDSWTTSGSIGTGNFWDSYLPSGLSASNSTDLSSLWNNTQANLEGQSLGVYNVTSSDPTNGGAQNQNAVLNNCESTLSGVVSPANWQADGDESKKKINLVSGTGLTDCSNAGYTGLVP